jgi:two-component system, OmpR family, sensor kinase
VRVPATAIAVFAISLAVALVVTYELVLQDGRSDIDVVLDREHQRFATAMAELLDDELEDEQATAEEALTAAVRRYLQLNPSNASYWTIVRFTDGRRLAAANGPPELEPLLVSGALPRGSLNTRETLETPAGQIRTSAAPVLVDGEQLATYQVVSPLAPVRQEAQEATWLLAGAVGITLLLGGALLSLSLWRSLAPLGALAGTARSTELRSLEARVDEPEGNDEVAQLAREFNTMLERLERSSAAQREFMASVSHELRTPITIARGHLEVLATSGSGNEPAIAETVEIVRDELTRMGRLVDDLLAIARAETQGFAQLRELELVRWFEDLELRIAGLGLPPTRVDPPPPVRLTADPDRLAQAVINLVVNAHVHTPPGTHVRVDAITEPGWLVIAVHDDGPGIDPSIRADAFDPFVQAGEATSSSGLGLAVVRAVVDAHSGEVELDTDHHGTRIALRLPWRGETASDDTVEILLPDDTPAVQLRHR